MDDVLNTVRHRRSVRALTMQIPDDNVIEQILEGARWAPSELNLKDSPQLAAG